VGVISVLFLLLSEVSEVRTIISAFTFLASHCGLTCCKFYTYNVWLFSWNNVPPSIPLQILLTFQTFFPLFLFCFYLCSPIERTAPFRTSFSSWLAHFASSLPYNSKIFFARLAILQWWRKQQFPPKRWYRSIKLHSVKSQKIASSNHCKFHIVHSAFCYQ
jgi:hypothetical protein